MAWDPCQADDALPMNAVVVMGLFENGIRLYSSLSLSWFAVLGFGVLV